MPNDSGAMLRLQYSARRLLIRYGGVRPFQLYVATKDLDAGSESWSASGDPVEAACALDEEVIRKATDSFDGGGAKVTLRETVLHVEVPAFAALGGLTSDWRWTDFEGVERLLQNIVLSEDGTYYVARMGSGG
jgi:hypothetical protein